MNTPLLLRIRRFAVGFLLAGLVAGSAPSLLAADDTKVHAELRQLMSVYENAINTGDLSPLAALFTPESSGVVVDNQPFKSLAELKAIYDKFHASFPGTVYRIKMDAEPSLLYGDLAVARGTCDESVKMSAGEFTYTSHWTAVLRRVDGQWKLVRSQFTMDPFGSSIVQFFVGKAKLYFGLGGLVAGLIFGFIGARLLSGRKSAAA